MLQCERLEHKAVKAAKAAKAKHAQYTETANEVAMTAVNIATAQIKHMHREEMVMNAL